MSGTVHVSDFSAGGATIEGQDRAVEALLRRLADTADDEAWPISPGSAVLLVPDVHHPYHPSTGLVTEPGVVEHAIDQFEARSFDVAVGVTSADAAEYLGVEAVADDCGVDVLDLDDAPETTRTVDPGGDDQPVAVPEPVDSRAVVPLPTLRRVDSGSGGAVAGAVACCSDLASGSPDPAAALAAVDPALAILDATYTAGTSPRSSGFLLGSLDPAAIDGTAAALLDTETRAPDLAPDSPSVQGSTIEALGRRVATGRPQATDPGSLMAAGYRLYARLVGDAIPPQFHAGGGGQ